MGCGHSRPHDHEVEVVVPPDTESLRAAIKWHPLEDLRIAINTASASVDELVMAEARARLAELATEALEAAVRKRQLRPLAATLTTAKEEGLVGEAAMAKALAMVQVLKAEPPGAEPPPAGTHSADTLTKPTHINTEEMFGPFMRYTEKTEVAVHDYKYWGGADQPWRNGVDDSAVTDAAVIASEEEQKLAVESHDQPTAGMPAHAELLRCCGVRIDFLLALTFTLGLWDWETWEVVQYLVKPITEASRCRFAELPWVRPFTGAATIFMSHCWGGTWCDLVAAACAGGDHARVVWIDVFAVRQWPGNGADLDFRGVLAGCTAAIVVAPPVGLDLTQKKIRPTPGLEDDVRTDFMADDDNKTLAKVMPFLRLWCVVEMAAALALKKPLVFWCAQVIKESKDYPNGDFEILQYPSFVTVWRGVAEEGGGGCCCSASDREYYFNGEHDVPNFLHNCSFLVNVGDADCAVPADKERELAAIGPANFERINKIVKAALRASNNVYVGNEHIFEVDAFNCGEPKPLRSISADRVPQIFVTACRAGQLAVLVELRRVQRAAVVQYLSGRRTSGDWAPVWTASLGGHCAVVEWLLGEIGASADAIKQDEDEEKGVGKSAIAAAAQEGHLKVVQTLIKAGADVHRTTRTGATPLFRAASNGYAPVVRALLDAGASAEEATLYGDSPLFTAAESGHAEVVRLLLEEGSSADSVGAVKFGNNIGNVRDPGECIAALEVASERGHTDVVQALLEAGAGMGPANWADGGSASKHTLRTQALFTAVRRGHTEVVRELAKAGADLEANRYGTFNQHWTPLMEAAYEGRLDMVRLLADELGACLDQEGESKWRTPRSALFMVAVDDEDNGDAMRVLLKAGAKVDQEDADGCTPLIVAARQGNYSVARALLEGGAEKDKGTCGHDLGQTPLSAARRHGHQRIVDLLEGNYQDEDEDEDEDEDVGGLGAAADEDEGAEESEGCEEAAADENEGLEVTKGEDAAVNDYETQGVEETKGGEAEANEGVVR